jgi:BASS family bile acid:Na+ symporter
MSLDQFINLLVTVTLLEMMVALGLGLTWADVFGVARDWRLVAKAALANYVCVPAVTVGLLLLFDPHPMVAAGFLVLAVCPGAPFGPPVTAIAKGNVAASVGLMVILAGSSAVLAPLLLRLLLPLTSGDEPLRIDALKLVSTLLLTQLLPLSAGLALRRWRPRLAARLRPPASLLSKVLALLAVGSILATQLHVFAEIRVRGYVGMLALLLASLAAGWLLGGPGSDNRKAMTLTTSLRNVAVGLVIVTGNFPGTPAVTAALAYGVLEVVGSLVLALSWNRLGATTPAPSPP